MVLRMTSCDAREWTSNKMDQERSEQCIDVQGMDGNAMYLLRMVNDELELD